jgi:4-hydroxybenzoate polyprenyltransferase
MVGLVRVVHPFPSTLDGVAASSIALIAGAGWEVALRIGLAMLGVQFCIGAVNDLTDADADADAKPSKPIPSGLLSRPAVAVVASVSCLAGLLMAASVSLTLALIAVLGLGDGLVYDLKLKRTPFAWMPFAAGVGLLPVYAWWGARGSVPPILAGIACVAVLAGTALALANAYADLEGDRRTGVVSIAALLGARATLRLNLVLMLGVQVLVVVTTLAHGSWLSPALGAELAGCGLGWLSFGVVGSGTRRWRVLLWELQGVGFLLLGAGWLVSLSSSAALRG